MTKNEIIEAIKSLDEQEAVMEIEGAARVRADEIRRAQPDADREFGDLWFVKQAREQYGMDDDVDVDDNATVSRGAEDGAYVQAWVFVYFPTAECEECGEEFEPMTDAYKCPACGTENYPPDFPEEDEYEP